MISLVENSGSRPQHGYLSQLVHEIFKKDGHLQTALQLDHRPQQASMAVAVAKKIEDDAPLLFEAGTGVGKSLAYLIPGLIHAINTERPLVVSSHTITLQEQIRSKDLKICETLFKTTPQLQSYANFKTALMVGRGNYCCSTRLSNALRDTKSEQSELFANNAREDLARIAKWTATTQNGLFQELSPPPLPDVWDAINADSTTCSRKNCDPTTCFYQKARKQLLGANCVIVNHSLLFSLINAGMPPKGEARGILLPDDFVVLDEAHRIPAIATDHFGTHVSSYSVDRTLKRLFNPRSKRGAAKKHGDQWTLAAIDNAIDAASEFFNYIGDTYLTQQTIRRIHDADFCDNILSSPLKEVTERLGGIIQKIDDERDQDELRDHRRRILGMRDAIDGFLRLAEDDHVHWLERSGKKGQIITLRSAPLDVAPYLRQSLFNRHTAAVLTSATLSDGHQMQTYQEKVGAQTAHTQLEHSPFDYSNNCRTLIATDSPAPEPNKGRIDLDYLANMICWCARRVQGGTLVLFTSHFDLRQVRERTEPFFNKIKRPLYAQGHELGRNELTQKFTQARNGILYGTESFWTGVDVPGPALSQVIIARLPFENPGHPILEARSEHCRENGGNPFADITVPEALVRFRQGIGRLIRRSNDQGNIVILDSRILTKPYGARFLEALHRPQYQRFNRHNREQIFSEYAFE